jgi:hypothetical protein
LTRGEKVKLIEKMKRSAPAVEGNMPEDLRQPKAPRLLRVGVDSRQSQSVPSSSAGNNHTEIQRVPTSSNQSASVGSVSVTPQQSIMRSQIQPHIAKRGLKRAGPYLLGKLMHLNVVVKEIKKDNFRSPLI